MTRVALCVSMAAAVLAAAFVAHAQHEESEAAAMRSLDDFLAAFNARDAEAWAATLSYPHVRIAGGDVKVYQTANEFAAAMDLEAFARNTGWHHSAWNSREVVQSSKDKVHIAVQFTRYKENGDVLSTYESLYIVTMKDGKWGTQARSSFAP